MFIGERVEERRVFTIEEKQAMLMKSRSKCASCGTLISLKSMSCEHVVPISRGGTNDLKNMVALCKECNTYKRNLLFLPNNYYSHLDNRYFQEICETFYGWFKEYSEDFDLTRHPLITPVTRIPLYKEVGKKRFLIGRNDLFYVNRDERKYIEDTLGIQLRRNTHYVLKSCKDDSILALFEVRMNAFTMDIEIVWTSLAERLVAMFVTSLIKNIANVYGVLKVPIAMIRVIMISKTFWKHMTHHSDEFYSFSKRYDMAIYDIPDMVGFQLTLDTGPDLCIRYKE